MSEPGERAIPVIGAVALNAVQSIEQRLDAGFLGHDVVGLAGQAQQTLGRASHVIRISGVLQGETYRDDLEALQDLAASGEETTFTADIISALDLQSVVVSRFAVRETAGKPGRASFEVEVVEAPPLPPPAQVSGFGGLGGLDDFGLGDLGFDTDIMGDLQDLAGDIAGAVDGALDAIEALDALAGLGDLGLDGPLRPLQDSAGGISSAGRRFGEAAGTLGGLFS